MKAELAEMQRSLEGKRAQLGSIPVHQQIAQQEQLPEVPILDKARARYVEFC